MKTCKNQILCYDITEACLNETESGNKATVINVDFFENSAALTNIQRLVRDFYGPKECNANDV